MVATSDNKDLELLPVAFLEEREPRAQQLRQRVYWHQHFHAIARGSGRPLSIAPPSKAPLGPDKG